jgi:hypothetical protein
MAVTEMVDTHEWEESHRQRQWFSPKQAMLELNTPSLTKMIKQLLMELERNGTGAEKLALHGIDI